jgi:hypothetical protein
MKRKLKRRRCPSGRQINATAFWQMAAKMGGGLGGGGRPRLGRRNTGLAEGRLDVVAIGAAHVAYITISRVTRLIRQLEDMPAGE